MILEGYIPFSVSEASYLFVNSHLIVRKHLFFSASTPCRFGFSYVLLGLGLIGVFKENVNVLKSLYIFFLVK